MRKTKLPKRELEICQRLREAREWCELNQAGCARQIGIERSTLLNYEQGRTPLRFGTALRFCRQFIISEEWLATGKYDACHAVAPQHGVMDGSEIEQLDLLIFRRQCVDLLSEPAALHIPPGALFSDAYDKTLAPEYARLVAEFFYLPRIVVTDSDQPELALNLLNAINDRFISLLRNEARQRGQKPSSAWRVYARCLLDSSDLIFRKMMRFHLDLERLHHLDWIRASVTDPDFVIPFLEEYAAVDTLEPKKEGLTDVTLGSNSNDVKPQIKKLVLRLKRATSAPGKKAELARFMKVAPARVSEWLSGQEPGGENTLLLLNWVEQQERQ
ncbi:MAG: helix-turn-helix transcriptional regulator [Verrucomicrobiae bacterium]|nr:helix-turn-helix transcriptional regulator [Verrucomicrobiae bacterium]